MGFVPFYRVLLGFTGFYWVSLGSIGFYWVELDDRNWLSGLELILASFTGFYPVLASFA